MQFPATIQLALAAVEVVMDLAAAVVLEVVVLAMAGAAAVRAAAGRAAAARAAAALAAAGLAAAAQAAAALAAAGLAAAALAAAALAAAEVEMVLAAAETTAAVRGVPGLDLVDCPRSRGVTEPCLSSIRRGESERTCMHSTWILDWLAKHYVKENGQSALSAVLLFCIGQNCE